MNHQFPKEIMDVMRDCILSIFWPKTDIISFFKNVGCTSKDLRGVEKFEEKLLSRSQIINTVFESLLERDDNGLGQFRAMLKVLIEWNHFDPYYFKKLGKLDENNAKRLITHLRQLQEIRDARLKERKRLEEIRLKEILDKRPRVNNLKGEFLDLYKGEVSNQERGYKLEKILKGVIEYERLNISDPFKISGEQIDGSLKYEGEHYLLEAKWHDKLIASDALYHFAYKVEGKMYGRGLFISINGFSPESVNALLFGKSIKTILIDGADLVLVLEEIVSFTEMLDAKIKCAQTMSKIYVDPITLKSKI
ncbi:hypothetical protein B5G50_27930 [Brevibacillus brevis]|uniref:restriction endonuclease n=1 Tax=Brevibacillus brevis TaxID=1393 RepID=UPI000B368B31|nr:restriction endonuclease [Brevibacillus brevis]OUQ85221.1 hypothetical protein B5G50_27930 [Brevibacillus brevis]